MAEWCSMCKGVGLVPNPDIDIEATVSLWRAEGFSRQWIDSLLAGDSFMGIPCPECGQA